MLTRQVLAIPSPSPLQQYLRGRGRNSPGPCLIACLAKASTRVSSKKLSFSRVPREKGHFAHYCHYSSRLPTRMCHEALSRIFFRPHRLAFESPRATYVALAPRRTWSRHFLHVSTTTPLKPRFGSVLHIQYYTQHRLLDDYPHYPSVLVKASTSRGHCGLGLGPPKECVKIFFKPSHDLGENALSMSGRF